MTKSSISKFAMALLAFPLVLALLIGGDGAFRSLNAQDKAEVKKKRAKPRGRLPAYYGQVVSPEQRKSIYAIQAKYASQIEDLQKQLTALKSEQNAEVEAVLTDEQKSKVAAAAAEAKAKRDKAAAERKKKKAASAE